jgi:predicted O-linked N-acetylglucosamine transferase (SPINDLY family)
VVSLTSPDALSRLRVALTACDSPAVSTADWTELRAALRAASQTCAQLPKMLPKSPLVAEACTLARAGAAMGAAEINFSGADLGDARAALHQGWPGLLAAMLLAPAWELPSAPRIDNVPDWLWGDYVAWLFAVPRDFTTPGLAARIAAQQLPHLADLNTWVGRNTGSTAVRAAVEAYLSIPPFAAARSAAGRRAAELRGQILTRYLVRREDRDGATGILPRDGRVLRVGFIGRDFGGSAAALSALGSFEMMDASAFDVFLFALNDSDRAEARHAGSRVRSKLMLLPDLAGQLRQLRASQLDVAVFCGDVGGQFDPIARIALHRVAPLQVVNHRTGLTSGLPEIDLYVSGAQPATAEAAAAFTERLGLLRGPAHTFAFPKGNAADALVCTREDLGLPADAVVFASVVASGGLDYETCRAWAGLLAQAPHARLALAVLAPEGEQGSRLARFCRSVEQVFSAAGVDTARVAIFPATAGFPEQPRNLLRIADLFLDGLSGADPIWVAEALALGLPALVLSQPANPDRDAAAGMLRALDLPGLIAADEAAYVETGAAMAANAAPRAVLRTRLKDALDTAPQFLDTLAAADAFGALLETAYDELAALDRAAFRAEREPLICFSADNLTEELEAGFAAQAAGDAGTAAFESTLALRADPANPRVRYLRAHVLLAEGKVQRATDYLLAALPHFITDKDFWFLLARTLQQNRQIPQAIEALESCLRLDGKQVEPLLMLVELAEAVGAPDVAADARQCLREIAPDDFRVLALN